jgi:hypothetical protein
MTFTPSFRVQDVTFNDETSVSMSTDIQSDIIVSMGSIFSIQLVYTGSPVGLLKLEYSLDKTNWSDASGTTTSISNADNTIYSLVNVAVPYIRIIFSRTSGSGTLTAKMCAKNDL